MSKQTNRFSMSLEGQFKRNKEFEVIHFSGHSAEKCFKASDSVARNFPWCGFKEVTMSPYGAPYTDEKGVAQQQYNVHVKIKDKEEYKIFKVEYKKAQT